jgi:hypothetical protein
MLTPDISLLTATVVATLAIGTIAIVIMTWRNMQATGGFAQLLARAEKKTPYHGEIDPRRFADRDRD